MKPAPFSYIRAETIEEVLSALHEHGSEARILAGGQSLMPMLNMRLAKPAEKIRIGEIVRRADGIAQCSSEIVEARESVRRILGRRTREHLMDRRQRIARQLR